MMYLDFHKNPGETLYDYIAYFYPLVRNKILHKEHIPRILQFENLTPQEKQWLHDHEAMPSLETVNTVLKNTELSFFMSLVNVGVSEHRILSIDDLGTLYELEELFTFFETHYTRVFGSLPWRKIWSRSVKGHSFKHLRETWGYWTNRECQAILLSLKPLTEKDNPVAINFEQEWRLFYPTRNLCFTGTRIEVKNAQRKRFWQVQQIIRYVVKSLESLRPEEGLVACCNG